MILKEKADNMQLLKIAGVWNKIVARFFSILFLARQEKKITLMGQIRKKTLKSLSWAEERFKSLKFTFWL